MTESLETGRIGTSKPIRQTGECNLSSKVYFTRDISSEGLIRLYDTLQANLPGKTGVKIHSGETGNQNFLRPELLGPLIHHAGCAIVECNTA